MANAYRCDRCGLYKDEGTRFRVHALSGDPFDLSSDYAELFKDLCPECKDDFDLFMEGFDIHPLRKIDVFTRTPKAEAPPVTGVLAKRFQVKKEWEKEL